MGLSWRRLLPRRRGGEVAGAAGGLGRRGAGECSHARIRILAAAMCSSGWGGAGVGSVVNNLAINSNVYDCGPHVDMAGGPWEGRRLGEQSERERDGGERQRCDRVRVVCGASPAVPGALEQRMEGLYFYQSEIPYDPPTQVSYSSAAGTNGWASYKVCGWQSAREACGVGPGDLQRLPVSGGGERRGRSRCR